MEMTATPSRNHGSRPRSTPCNLGCRKWCRKYFWEGQVLEKDTMSEDLQFFEKRTNNSCLQKLLSHRRALATLIPALLVHALWWPYMVKSKEWYLFNDNYFMTLTMVFGSLIAGMTSEGGGAVAFPVMTLAFKISPNVARDFSIMIQAVGMTTAAFAILYMRVQLEWHSLSLCSVGGTLGIILGLEVVCPLMPPSFSKMAFVCIWFSFAFSLFLLNRYRKRQTFPQIPCFTLWKGLVLMAGGFVGGLITSFSGSGLDICSFSVLTILFRVSEKIATPTSVVLMAGNSMFGFYWRHIIMGTISEEAWTLWKVCIPVVVLGAPLGSVIGTHFHRQVLAALVYILDTVALISAFILVKQTPLLAGVSCGLLAAGFIFFLLLTWAGSKLLDSVENLRRTYEQTVSPQEKPLFQNGATPLPITILNSQYETSSTDVDATNGSCSATPVYTSVISVSKSSDVVSCSVRGSSTA